MSNKVKYGISNVYYAVITTESDSGFPTYGTPKPLPGAVSLTLDAQGDVDKFHADNGVYFQTAANNGYEGDFEIALIPESFREDVLKEVQDAGSVLMEKSNVEIASFALMFQTEGNKGPARHLFYNCTVTRPSSEHSTVEDTITPQTDTLRISAVSLANGYVKAKALKEAAAAAFDTWYDNVYLPQEG